MLTCAPGTFADHDAGQAVLRTVRDLYADYVMKNPFYEAEMPIRCELFEKRLRDAIDAVERGGVSEGRGRGRRRDARGRVARGRMEMVAARVGI